MLTQDYLLGGGTTSSGSHLDYSGDAEAAAKFIVGVVGL